MPPLTRRAVVRLGAASLASGLAGCSGFEQAERPQLGKLTAENYDTEPHRVSVLLLDGEEPVYWAQKTATAAQDNVVGGAVFEGFPTYPGDHVLHARVDNQSKSEWADFDFSEYDTSCLGIAIQIGDIATESDDLSIWYTTDPSICDSDSTPA